MRLLSVLLLWLAPIAPLAASSHAADVDIVLDSLGISGSFRPGNWTPVRLALTSNLDDTASVLISFEVPNSDGDIERYTRPVVLAPGQTVSRWVYPRLPPNSSARQSQGTIYRVRIYENDDGVPGSEIASVPVSGSSSQQVGTPIEMTQDFVLVVGTGGLGLQGYGQRPRDSTLTPSLNERTILVNAKSEELPDRWQGFASVSTIIWSDASPQALGLDEAAALRAWIQRGGRFIVVLPESDDPWAIGSSGRTLLSDLLPASAPRRIPDVPITSLLQSLSKSPKLRNADATMSIRIFDADTIEAPWNQLAALPAAPDSSPTATAASEDSLDGAVYAVQRRLGHGWIVVVGIDADALNRRQLQADGLPQPDVFWNRLLGRRGTIPTPLANRAYQEEEILKTGGTSFGLGSGTLILDQIRIGGPSAGLGMLVALGIFIAYWVLAGPASYALLRARGMVRHSWMGFVCVALVFTVIALLAAWGGRVLLQRDAPVRHFTFLDIIDGEDNVRATTWFSAYLPGYGDARIAVPGEGNLLATWSPPPSGSLERFPNSDVFQIPTDSANEFSIPSRATSAHFVAHWQGQLTGDWSQVPEQAETEIRQVLDSNTSFSLSGVIRHGLPWTLESVQIGSISPFRSPLPSYILSKGVSVETPIDALPNAGVIFSMGKWATGSALDLSDTSLGGPYEYSKGGARILGQHSITDWMEAIYEVGPSGIRPKLRASMQPESLWRGLVPECIQMYATFQMLPQPAYLKGQTAPRNDDATPIHFVRWLGRETDCSSWFLQPCVFIYATINDVPLPVPVEVDGEAVESRGTVVLRWLHPLPVVDRLVPPVPRTLREFQAPRPADSAG